VHSYSHNTITQETPYKNGLSGLKTKSLGWIQNFEAEL
jgi:hypothetical protein